jgi:peptide/nickel transport system ATP-binding protein
LSVRRGRTYGLVGESGSGKTTLARMVVGLTDRDAGQMTLMGIDVPSLVGDRSLAICAELQMIFQNPQNSLNPYRTVRQSIRRPIIKLAGMSRPEADREVDRLLASVRLRAEYASRYPGELSGGELQRVAIARALASNPGLIVCDEPISSLDVSVQSALLNLLAQLQEERGTSYLFISHDLSAVSYLADYVAVMYLGELFEVGYARDLFTPPLHPYTEALISAIPIPDPQRKGNQILLTGDIPASGSNPSGCAFHSRCPHKIGAICETQPPPWHDDGDEHHVRCHIPLEELTGLQSYLLKEKAG